VHLLLPLGLALSASSLAAPRESDSFGPAAILHHDVEASIDPVRHRLIASDRVRLARIPRERESWRFLLHQDLAITSVRARGDALSTVEYEGFDPRHFWERPPYAELESFEVAREVEVLAPERGWGGEALELVIEYDGVIADSLHAPEASYERSTETTSGRIVEEGAYLSGATFWVPWVGETLFTFRVTADAPEGWEIVSQGEFEHSETRNALRRTIWDSKDFPSEEIFLIAGPYDVSELTHETPDGRPVLVRAYCYENTEREISDRYLHAAGPAIDRFSALFGSYPYPKFALVENYWQTGSGMPSFTLLGDRVLRLPFIVDTSYPHEILHNWWGNGVYVNREGGNWCEGLTAYCADYLAKEAEGEDAARAYRRSTLVRYHDFASKGGKDFALARFREREDAATQAVGYGKSLMVFHMLRRDLGEQIFFGALRRFYAAHLFEKASWHDLEAAFEAESSRDLTSFFEQWLSRTGAPNLSLDSVSIELAGQGSSLSPKIRGAEPAAGSEGATKENPDSGNADGAPVIITGFLLQQEPVYELAVPIVAEATGHATGTSLVSKGARTPFRIECNFRPEVLKADPSFDLFRALHLEEVPPSLSGVLGAPRTRIVLGADVVGELRAALEALAKEWASGENVTVVEEFASESLADFDGGTWFLGEGRAARRFRERDLRDEDVPAGSGSLVLAGRLEGREDRPAALFLPEAAEAALAIARKLPHYATYSYLVFEGTKNVEKGIWRVGPSPLSRSFGAESTRRSGAERSP
jgi:hypothetical protein